MLLHALQTASSGMIAQQMNIDNIANNLANVNTTGYKKSRTDFQDLIYLYLGRQGAGAGSTGSPLQIGLGARLSGTPVDFSQGNWQPTGNPLDLAIRGNAFFKVEANGNTYFTRDGSFRLDAEGNLLSGDGYKVTGAEEITGSDIEIALDGKISYTNSSGTTASGGQIELATFSNPSGLEKIGGNLYRSTAASGEAEDWDGTDGDISIQQGFLESSNVQVVTEMVNMITAQRAYETNSKVIQASDDMLGIANNLRR